MQNSVETFWPRVTADVMPTFAGRKVRFVGKINDQSPGRIVLVDHEGTTVSVETLSNTNFCGPYLEVTGTVKSPGVLAADGIHEFGDNFDLQLCAEAIKLSMKVFEHLQPK